MGISVSIIIVNYNTAELLNDCIGSVICNTKGVDYEIIVVDNDSEAGSVDYLTSKYTEVHFIFSDENLGFGRANNLGASYAKGKYLFFLNPDTLLLNNAIFILYEFMEVNPQAGACGGNLYKQDNTPAISFHTMSFYTREWRILLNKKWPLGFNITDKPQDVSVIMGADLFIRRDIFNRLKGFDPDFFLYFEEVYLCDVVRRAGYKMISVPQARIIHLEGAAAENKSDELNKWSYQEHWYSKFIYFRKTKGKLRMTLIYYGHILKLKIAMLVYSIRDSPEKLDYWNKKYEVLKKTYSRYRQYLER
jgi:GT2 family glycosyltransferase